MTSPLIRALTERHGFAEVDDATIDDFLAAHAQSVLFFTGDPERAPESNDVAVILLEILKVYGKRLAPAVVSRAGERKLQLRFRFNAFPTLVFLRGAGYLGALSRVLDWSDYMSEVPRILALEPSEPPPYAFPDGCSTNGPAHAPAEGGLQ